MTIEVVKQIGPSFTNLGLRPGVDVEIKGRPTILRLGINNTLLIGYEFIILNRVNSGLLFKGEAARQIRAVPFREMVQEDIVGQFELLIIDLANQLRSSLFEIGLKVEILPPNAKQIFFQLEALLSNLN